ncbi:hypothetical protein ACOMHN_022966 [Nucella lapillus]
MNASFHVQAGAPETDHQYGPGPCRSCMNAGCPFNLSLYLLTSSLLRCLRRSWRKGSSLRRSHTARCFETCGGSLKASWEAAGDSRHPERQEQAGCH